MRRHTSGDWYVITYPFWYNLINITFNIDVRDDIRVREYTHITLLAMAEVSRHMPNLRRIAAVEFPYRDFNDLCFAVSFATNPPTLKLETTQMIKKKKKYKHVVEDLLRREGSYDSSRVALLRIEALMDLWPDYVDSMYRLVELDKTGSDNRRLTAILEAGKVMGGTQREPCFIGRESRVINRHWKPNTTSLTRLLDVLTKRWLAGRYCAILNMPPR